MKTHKKFFRTLIVFFLILGLGSQVTYSQDAGKSKKASKDSIIQSLVHDKDFVFVAQTVYPMGAPVRQLTSLYDLQISSDTIVSNLPYFGRAYSAPINPAEGGFNFTSTKFEYDLQDQKKGGWNILIKPKDASDVQQLNLGISESGSARLQVTSVNRQPISFNGYITARKTNK